MNQLQKLIQTSSYSKEQIIEALEYFESWNERHGNKGTEESRIGYLQCCAESAVLKGDQRKFVDIVREMLEEFGYEGR